MPVAESINNVKSQVSDIVSEAKKGVAQVGAAADAAANLPEHSSAETMAMEAKYGAHKYVAVACAELTAQLPSASRGI